MSMLDEKLDFTVEAWWRSPKGQEVASLLETRELDESLLQLVTSYYARWVFVSYRSVTHDIRAEPFGAELRRLMAQDRAEKTDTGGA